MAVTTTSLDTGTVTRTDPRLDNMVRHLGYEPVDSRQTLMTDRDLIKASQERLRKAEAIPDEKLGHRQRAHLILARSIATVVFCTSPPPVHVAVIPPASDRVRTAGMYATTTMEVYIALEMMERSKTMIDTLVHELAHHRQYRAYGEADDLTPAHAAAMTGIAATIVGLVSRGIFDDLLKEATW